MGLSGRDLLLPLAVFSWIFGGSPTEQSTTAAEDSNEDSFEDCAEEFKPDETHEPSTSPPEAYTDKAVIVDVSHVSAGNSFTSTETLKRIFGIFKKATREGFRHFVLVGDGHDTAKPTDLTPQRPGDLYNVVRSCLHVVVVVVPAVLAEPCCHISSGCPTHACACIAPPVGFWYTSTPSDRIFGRESQSWSSAVVPLLPSVKTLRFEATLSPSAPL